MANAVEPFLTAAREGRADAVKKLLAKGVKPRTDSWKQSALHLCAIDGHIEVAKLLLAHGLDPNALDKSRMTPLLRAVDMFASPAFVRLLLDHGADATVRNDAGETAVDLIFRRVDGQGQPMNQRRRSIGKLLLEHGAPATPEQIRRLGGSDATAAKAKIAMFDWAALEAQQGNCYFRKASREGAVRRVLLRLQRTDARRRPVLLEHGRTRRRARRQGLEVEPRRLGSSGARQYGR